MNIEKLNSEFQRKLSIIIQREVKDKQIGFITITEVKIKPDLSNAIVYFTTLNKEGRKDNALNALNRAKGFIKRQLAEATSIRHIPELEFKYDTSLDYGNKIDKLLTDIK